MTEKAIYEIVLKNQKFNDGLKDSEKKLNSFENSLKDLQQNIVSAFAVGALVSFGTEAYKTSTQLQSLRNSIVFASGSSKEGAENLNFLSDISDRMGLNLMATTEGFRTFSGALIGSRFEGQKARDIFEKISTGISVMGLSADDAKGAFLALGQMVSKGTVSAEELRGQLGERLPGAFQIAARSLGVTTKHLGDMLKAGEVMTEDFLPKFADEIEKTFKGGLSKAAQSQAADLAKLENKWLSFKDLIGMSIAPTIHALVSDTKSLSDQFADQKAKVESLQRDFKPLLDRYKELKQYSVLNNEQQIELKGIIKDISEQMPSAVTAWNSYGEAIDINTGKVEKNITKNREALKLLNAGAIKDVKDELLGQAGKALKIKDFLESYSKNGITESTLEKFYKVAPDQYTKLTDQVASDLAGQLHGITGEGGIIQGLKQKLEDLQGGNKLSDFIKGKAALDAKYSPTYMSEPEEKKKKKKKDDVSGVEKISSGTRNITINITKLVETVNISKTFGKNSDSELVNAVKRALLTGVNDVNIVAQ